VSLTWAQRISAGLFFWLKSYVCSVKLSATMQANPESKKQQRGDYLVALLS
jgi:hypothetical protein